MKRVATRVRRTRIATKERSESPRIKPDKRMPGTGMQIAWLLSLAAGVTALNVTLTNNLVGVTTVRVHGAGLARSRRGRSWPRRVYRM